MENNETDGYTIYLLDTGTNQITRRDILRGTSNTLITLYGIMPGATYDVYVSAMRLLAGQIRWVQGGVTTQHCQSSGNLIPTLLIKNLDFTGIYITHKGTCYLSDEEIFYDYELNSVNHSLSCVLPSASLTTGQWVRVADSDEPVSCNNTDFHCTSVNSTYASLGLYFPSDTELQTSLEGLYKCCLHASCTTSGTSQITAFIYSEYSVVQI